AIEHVHLESALCGEQRREQTDRPGAGDQRDARLPARALTDPVDVIPALRDHAGRLEQDAERAERRRDGDGELGLETKTIGRVAVTLLDPALGEAPVAAHVPLTGS